MKLGARGLTVEDTSQTARDLEADLELAAVFFDA